MGSINCNRVIAGEGHKGKEGEAWAYEKTTRASMDKELEESIRVKKREGI